MAGNSVELWRFFEPNGCYTHWEKEYFYSLKRIEYKWHGSWSDPELIYKGKHLYYYEIEEFLYDDYKEYLIEMDTMGIKPYSFEKWIEKNKTYCYNLIDEFLDTFKEY